MGLGRPDRLALARLLLSPLSHTLSLCGLARPTSRSTRPPLSLCRSLCRPLCRSPMTLCVCLYPSPSLLRPSPVTLSLSLPPPSLSPPLSVSLPLSVCSSYPCDRAVRVAARVRPPRRHIRTRQPELLRHSRGHVCYGRVLIAATRPDPTRAQEHNGGERRGDWDWEMAR